MGWEERDSERREDGRRKREGQTETERVREGVKGGRERETKKQRDGAKKEGQRHGSIVERQENKRERGEEREREREK